MDRQEKMRKDREAEERAMQEDAAAPARTFGALAEAYLARDAFKKQRQRKSTESAIRYNLLSPERNPWLETNASEIDDGDVAAVIAATHHLPHAKSIPSRFEGDLLNAAFASDLSEVIESGRPALWVHGHTHDSCDYKVGSTRIICNPRGYEDENGAFDPALVVRMM
ncbi:hypothetical protein C1D09_003815 [Mesorhizobium intechi]|uniref:hypothetical protein n=1 Tax=Mesorhizobium intechi TaxID=537601 RepID=UPI000CC7A34D|nr:hypothetical protein [Mesorhizobium intechi]TSE13470.1 hypothetical protein C1D09_003815 [Mesorhizobium intechi]